MLEEGAHIRYTDCSSNSATTALKRGQKIGQGQYGTVYLATNITTQERVALKELSMDDENRIPASALKEITFLQQLQHCNIVQLKDVLTHLGKLTSSSVHMAILTRAVTLALPFMMGMIKDLQMRLASFASKL